MPINLRLNKQKLDLFKFEKKFTLTVNCFHLPVLAAVKRSVKPFVTSGNSAGVGGLNSTLAYLQKVFKRGVENSTRPSI